MKDTFRTLLVLAFSLAWAGEICAQTCGTSVNAPATINGITITGAGTGSVQTYVSSYTSCGNITTPTNSLHLGSAGSFSYTYTFSQPVNDFVFIINATGQFNNEVFTFTTNGGGIPVITGTSLCFTTITGNVVSSGAGASATGGGGIFSVTNPSGPFTTLTITGPGGDAGSLFALCSASTAFTCTKPDAGTDLTGVCSGTSIALSATSATSGNWFAQGGNPSGATLNSGINNTATVDFATTAAGDYFFIFATGSCSDTVRVNVSSIIADAGTDKNISCYLTETVMMTAGGTGAWSPLASNPGTSSISDVNSPSATISNFQNPGTYYYVWTVAGCIHADTVAIMAANNCGCAQPPVIILNSDSGAVCVGQSATIAGMFSGSATAVHAASSGSGTFSAVTATVSPFSFTYTPGSADITAGSVLLQFITDNPLGGACLPDTSEYFLSIHPLPVADAGEDTLVNCAFPSITLVAASPSAGVTFSWSNGISGAANAVTSPGTYSVTVADALTGCAAADTVVVSQDITPPVVSISGGQPLRCNVSSVTLTADVNVATASLMWSTNESSASIVVDTEGVYSVTAISAVNGCQSSASAAITRDSEPQATFATTDNPCPGVAKGAITPTVSGGIPPYDFSWSDNSTDSVLSNVQAGNYSVTITDQNGCSVTQTFTLTSGVFSVTALQSDTLTPDESVQLSVSATTGASGLSGIAWSPAQFLTCSDCAAPVARPLHSVSYVVSVTDTSGCSATDTVHLVVVDVDYTIYVPNAFTPNGDGVNDFFEVFGGKNDWQTMEMKIFDRWGTLVFQSTDPAFAWDGHYKGRPLTPQTLVYLLDVTFVNGRKSHYNKGSLTLIR